MKKIFAILIVVSSLQASAQDTLTGKCWTPEMDTTEFQNQPWFSNNDYLEHFLDSIGYPAAGSGNRIVGAPQVRFWIPIKFWIYRDDNGNGGPTFTQIQTLIDDLNRRYNQTNNAWIGFYMKCEPTYINNSAHVVKTFTGASILMATNNDQGSINVHIIGSFASGNSAGFAIPFLNACMIPSDAYLISTANGDLAHEIGHVLGMLHTHQYSSWNWKCLTESVSRTRTWPTFSLCPTRLVSNRVCEATGDALRDTQADDNLVSNNACSYNVNFGNDEWGDSYDNPPAGIQDRPNFRNIMSYNSATNCVDQFSRLQIGVMLWTLYFKKTNNLGGWLNPIGTFDDFEPDNNAEMTININRHIQINQIQERNFHQQWNRVGELGYITQCDVDWVRFVAPCNSNFEVFTSAMPNRTNANTRLTLFDNNLVQLAQNDDISPTNQFSSIQFNFLAGVEYFIRVENMSNLTTGYYNLQVGRFSIQGNSTLCAPSTYTIQNLPTGATVTWSATPTGIVSFNPLGPTINPSTTVTKVNDGAVTITATINSCGNQFVLSKPVVVGASITGYYIISSNYHQPIQRPLYSNNSPIWLPANQSFSIAAYVTNSNPISPSWSRAASSYPFNWGSSGVQLSFSGSSGSTSNSVRNGIFDFTANTGCGTTTTSFTWPVIVQGWGFSVVTVPNPASDNLTVSIVDESDEVKALSKNETVTITLYDLNSTIVKIWTFKNNQVIFNLNISNLKKGHYVLKVQKGKYQQSDQIVVN